MTRPLSERMFFIIGRGRSGTTLLARQLDAHPELAVAPESLFVLYLRDRYSEADWSDPRTVRRFARDLWQEERMRRWNLDQDELEERLAAVAEPTFASMAAEVYRASAVARHGREPRMIGDKNPHYTLFVPELAAIFPAARFIYLLRNPCANVASYQNVRFDMSSVSGLAERWCLYNQSAAAALATLPGRSLTLHFGSLVRDPSHELARVCDFLGVDFDDTMILGAVQETGTELAWHPNLSRPPDPAIAEAWKERLTSVQADRVRGICGPLASRLGVPLEGTGESGWRDLPGRWAGRALTALERLVFRLPLEVRATITRLYRLSTGNRIR